MLEFRDAAPYNRIRYLIALIAIICVSTLFREARHSNNAHNMLQMAQISHAFLTIYVEIANPLGTV